MYKLLTVDDNTWAYETVMDDGDSVRFFVLDGQDRCLVIDSGFFPVDVKTMVLELLKSQGRGRTSGGEEKPVILANTHGDMDHTGGNASFASFYMTGMDYENCGISEKCPDSVLIPAEEGTVIELGGRTIRYIMAPGHTYGNAVLLDVTNRTLYPGDMVQTGTMFMFGPHRCPDKLRGSLEKLRDMQDVYDRIYACHGQMIMPADAVDREIEAWDRVFSGEVQPERREVFDMPVDLYRCGFSNFYCNTSGAGKTE